MVWPDWLLSLPLTSPRARLITISLGVVILLALLWRRRGTTWGRWLLLNALALVLGAAAGVALVWAMEHPLEITGGPLPDDGRRWIVAAVAGIAVCIVNLFRTRWPRRLGAIVAIPVFAAIGGLGVNAAIGVTPTLGLTLGIASGKKIELPKVASPSPTPSASATVIRPLWQSWKPPAGMPAVGQRGTLDIPGTTSGFVPRTGGVYLPPAALVPNAPALPVVVMLMGQPGTPDVQYIADTLDAYAAKHNGLAPIAIVADQLGDSTHDTICSDTHKYGKVETYINVDVVAAIKAKFNIKTDRKDWAIAGYSNGGTCAARFGTLHSDIWGSLLAIAPEEFPGSTSPKGTLKEFYKGDQALFDANKIPNQMRARTFPDTTAIFTYSADDIFHIPGVKAVETAAKDAGMKASLLEFPTGGHGVDTLRQGLNGGIEILGKRFELAAP